MTLFAQVKAEAFSAIKSLYPQVSATENQITINITKPEFEGDYTVVLFPFVKSLGKNPKELGTELGEYLLAHSPLFSGFSIVSGFLNLTITPSFWPDFLLNHFNNIHFGEKPKQDFRAMVEYSSPNTNKPLHFGHLRNIFLGAAMAEILHANGQQSIKANLVNDRGIHICKSMVAWQKFGEGATPETAVVKGDHLVGDYYVRFNNEYKAEIQKLVAEGMEEKIAEKEAPIMQEAQQMLRDWEADKPEVKTLWAEMNGWVYKGFERTYNDMGITFDKTYYESDTYLLGKEVIAQGLNAGVLFKKEDGSVWIDLTNDGLDEKLLLRGDGTAVYITQDIGTAVLKQNEYKLDSSIYVIGDEQDYHMKVLKLILEKMELPAAKGVHHLSYGMVELPTGKMKSREGTVVDADDMVAEMIALAKEQTEAAGKTEGFTAEELDALYKMIGVGALKFYLLRVEPRKKMIFNPAESIDLHGFTSAFVQYAHARICSILRKMGVPKLPGRTHFQQYNFEAPLLPAEKDLVMLLEQYPTVVEAAGADYNPSLLCNYAFSLAQSFNTFYDQHSIANAENADKKGLRVMLIVMTAQVLRHSMNLLGIRLPERM